VAEARTTLTPAHYERVDALLGPVDAARQLAYPGNSGRWQPVHTVYVPADRVDSNTCREWGSVAAATLAEHAPNPAALAELIDCPDGIAESVYERVTRKLGTQPIEDLRVDFEDGYGARPDEEEEATATVTATALTTLAGSPGGPSRAGVRVKGLEAAIRRRGLRTLDLIRTAIGPAEWFVVTLPKVTDPAQVAAFAEACDAWPGMRFEIQIETPQAVLGADGTALVARMITAGAGLVVGLHYGTYDYSAACGIAVGEQNLEHPAADHAKAVMQVAAAGTGVDVCDGSSNVLPVGAGARDALRLHARLVRRSLRRGDYQGWDLHPGQLVTRYAATYAFYRDAFASAADRLAAYLGRSGGAVLDEPATAQGIAAVLVRGLRCGALDEAEVLDRTGVDRAALDALFARRVG
jgi:citrate lyase beta subunit